MSEAAIKKLQSDIQRCILKKRIWCVENRLFKILYLP
jgi:hypothetical protein